MKLKSRERERERGDTGEGKLVSTLHERQRYKAMLYLPRVCLGKILSADVHHVNREETWSHSTR